MRKWERLTPQELELLRYVSGDRMPGMTFGNFTAYVAQSLQQQGYVKLDYKLETTSSGKRLIANFQKWRRK